MERVKPQYAVMAFAAAALYAASAPASKLLLEQATPVFMASFLYLGAGIGMSLVGMLRKSLNNGHKETRLDRSDLTFVVLMIILDIIAPILLMIGLRMTTASNASLLNNFEIAATSMIAFMLFGEPVTKRLWKGIAVITAASMLLSLGEAGSLNFSLGSVFVLLAATAWGFENNCTRMLSLKDPLQVVVLKGLGSGAGSLIVAFLIGDAPPELKFVLYAMILGFFSYGMSIWLYVYAQRGLGAARTSSYYAVAPFIGATISYAVFHDPLSPTFLAALVLMMIGSYLAAFDGLRREKQST